MTGWDYDMIDKSTFTYPSPIALQPPPPSFISLRLPQLKIMQSGSFDLFPRVETN